MLKCSICFENINNNNVKYLPCFHSFHSSCINKWVDKKKNPKCPLCRSNTVSAPKPPCKHVCILCPNGFGLQDYQEGGVECESCGEMVLNDVAPCEEACGCCEDTDDESSSDSYFGQISDYYSRTKIL